MHEILKKLAGGDRRSTGRANEVVSDVLNDPALFQVVFCALSLLSEIMYGAEVSTRDPARFSFAHGGKDGFPYPVDRATYDRSIETLRTAIRQAKLGRRDKLEAFKRLALWEKEAVSDE
jgi:hypothetical protein